MYYLMVKSGTNGYSDYDDCDMKIAEIPSNNIPSVGSIIDLNSGTKRQKYLVREVEYNINLATDRYDFGEWIYVYVINA